MTKLERLRADHEPALLAFERENREYFARYVSDRGDAFFAEFTSMLRARLAEQETGLCHFHVVVDEQGEVIGRVNLVDVSAGSAELGYRIGERAGGRGVATAMVREVCRIAVTEYGLLELMARVMLDNPASAAVLLHNGFTVVDDDIRIGGQPGVLYRRRLTATH